MFWVPSPVLSTLKALDRQLTIWKLLVFLWAFLGSSEALRPWQCGGDSSLSQSLEAPNREATLLVTAVVRATLIDCRVGPARTFQRQERRQNTFITCETFPSPTENNAGPFPQRQRGQRVVGSPYLEALRAKG